MRVRATFVSSISGAPFNHNTEKRAHMLHDRVKNLTCGIGARAGRCLMQDLQRVALGFACGSRRAASIAARGIQDFISCIENRMPVLAAAPRGALVGCVAELVKQLLAMGNRDAVKCGIVLVREKGGARDEHCELAFECTFV